MKIYVACLAAYNEWFLHGAWINCEGKSAEQLKEEAQQMLKASPAEGAEEWAIHDYEGFGSYKVEEWTSFDEIAELAEAIKNSGHDLELISGVMDELHVSAQEAIEYIEDNYLGEFDSLTAYAWDYLESTGEWDSIPKHLQGYFDIDAYTRDIELNGEVITIGASNRNIYVLSNS